MLPIDRSSKTALDGNLVNGNTSDAPVIKNSNDVVYNTIDELNAKVDGLVGSSAIVPYPTSFLSRQAIINGNFELWQRGTSFAVTGIPYTADRWKTYRSAQAAGMTVSRQDGSGVYGSRYCLRAQRDSGNAAVNDLIVEQVFESVDSQKFRGKKVTISFNARIGPNYSAAASALSVVLAVGTGTDESGTGTITGFASVINRTYTLTTSWQRFTATTSGVLADTVNQLFLTLTETPVGTAGANDYFEITQVQLNAGDQAVPFQPKSYADELQSCMRFGEIIGTGVHGRWLSATNAKLYGSFKVTKRVAPTLKLLSASTTIEEMNVANRTAAASTIATQTTQTNGYAIEIGGFTSATPGNGAASNVDFGFADSEL